MSVTPTPSDGFDDFDIYADLPAEDRCPEKAKEVCEDYENIKLELKKVQSELKQSQGLNEKLKSLNKELSHNISVLFKTASAEIKRKDDKIAELHRELDDLAFRRKGRRKNGNQPSLSGKNLINETFTKQVPEYPTHQSSTSSKNFSGKIEVDVLKQSSRSGNPPLEEGNKCIPTIDVETLKANIQHSIRNPLNPVKGKALGDLPSKGNSSTDAEVVKVLPQGGLFLSEKKTLIVEETKMQSPIKTIPKKRKILEYSAVSDENSPVSKEIASRVEESDKMKEVKAPLKKSVFDRIGTKLHHTTGNKEVAQEDVSKKSNLNIISETSAQYNEKEPKVPNIPLESSTTAILNAASEKVSKLQEVVPIELPKEAEVSSNSVRSLKSISLSTDCQEIENCKSSPISSSHPTLDKSCSLENNRLKSSSPNVNGCHRSETSRPNEENSEKPSNERNVHVTNIIENSVTAKVNVDNSEDVSTPVVESKCAVPICVEEGSSDKSETSLKSSEEFPISSGGANEPEICSDLQISFQPPLPSEAPKPPPPLPLSSPPPTPIKIRSPTNVCSERVDSQPVQISHEESTTSNPCESKNKLGWSNENLLIQCPFKPRRRAKTVVLQPIDPLDDSHSHAEPRLDVNSKLGSSEASSKILDPKLKKTPLHKTDSYENRLAYDSRSHHSQRSVYGSRHLSSVKSLSHLPERRSPSELLSGRSGRIERLSHPDKIRVRLRDRRSRSLSPLRRRTKQDGYRTRNGQYCETSRRCSQRVQTMKDERYFEQGKTKSVPVKSKPSSGSEKEKQNTKSRSNSRKMADLFGESSPEPEEKNSMCLARISTNCGPEKRIADSTKAREKEGMIVIKHKPRSMICLSNSDGSSPTPIVIVSKSPKCPTPESKETVTSSIPKQSSSSYLPNNVTRPLYFREKESRKRCISDDSNQECEFSVDSDESSVKPDSDETYLPSKSSKSLTRPQTVKRKR
ncbi:CASP8-associated protein 2 [Frankliniella fusca]|uniref:CASP8-associated protein 2 n=1 Tax=Frankliniella fusca TaxID=407009 RepID=A0AAE1GZM8_9NEOP|nr:CASP8-associated protein 2 [Frankliniella fusca]